MQVVGYFVPVQPILHYFIMQRDRALTEQRLIDAVGQVITENGFDQLGINKVAGRAGVHKILIYRYFGGLNGLLEAYYAQNRHVISSPALDIEQLKDAPLDEVFDACYEYLINEYRLLRQNVEAREFLKASLMSNDGLFNPVATEKDGQFQRMVDELALLIKTENGRSFAAIVVSAMTLLTFMSQEKRTVLGIDLSTDDGWAQIEIALKNIYRGAYLFTKERLDSEGEKPA